MIKTETTIYTCMLLAKNRKWTLIEKIEIRTYKLDVHPKKKMNLNSTK